MKYLIFFVIGLMVGTGVGLLLSSSEHHCMNEDYKKAFIDHKEKCDTTHKNCVTIGK